MIEIEQVYIVWRILYKLVRRRLSFYSFDRNRNRFSISFFPGPNFVRLQLNHEIIATR
jgi:hypothetical protein